MVECTTCHYFSIKYWSLTWFLSWYFNLISNLDQTFRPLLSWLKPCYGPYAPFPLKWTRLLVTKMEVFFTLNQIWDKVVFGKIFNVVYLNKQDKCWSTTYLINGKFRSQSYRLLIFELYLELLHKLLSTTHLQLKSNCKLPVVEKLDQNWIYKNKLVLVETVR